MRENPFYYENNNKPNFKNTHQTSLSFLIIVPISQGTNISKTFNFQRICLKNHPVVHRTSIRAWYYNQCLEIKNVKLTMKKEFGRILRKSLGKSDKFHEYSNKIVKKLCFQLKFNIRRSHAVKSIM